MRRLGTLILVAAAAAAGYACGSSPPNPQAASPGVSSPQARVPGEYLVTVAASSGVKAINDLYGRFGIKGLKEIAPDVFLVTLAEDPGPATMEKLRAGTVSIRSVEPNLLYHTQGGGGVQ